MKRKVEVWKVLKTINGVEVDFKYRYKISSLGRIKKDNKLLKPYKGSTGYLFVDLKILVNNETKRKTCQMHRLVAERFIDNPSNKPEVNHLDGDKTNNEKYNLAWATRKENIQHAFATGLMKPKKGQYNGRTKLTDKQVHMICKDLEKGLRDDEILKKRKFLDKSDLRTIYSIRTKETWMHISDNYKFSTVGRKASIFSEKEIFKICELIIKGKSNKEIYEKVPKIDQLKQKSGLISEIKAGLRYKRIYTEVQRLSKAS